MSTLPIRSLRPEEMKKNTICIAMFASGLLTLSEGCDLGTYQKRANEPVPANTVRAEDLGSVTPASDSGSESETSE